MCDTTLKKKNRVNNQVKSEDETIEVVVKFVGVLRTVLKVPQTRIRLEKGVSLHDTLVALAKLYGKPGWSTTTASTVLEVLPYCTTIS